MVALCLSLVPKSSHAVKQLSFPRSLLQHNFKAHWVRRPSHEDAKGEANKEGQDEDEKELQATRQQREQTCQNFETITAVHSSSFLQQPCSISAVSIVNCLQDSGSQFHNILRWLVFQHIVSHLLPILSHKVFAGNQILGKVSDSEATSGRLLDPQFITLDLFTGAS